MKKLLIAVLPVIGLLTGCNADVDSSDDSDETGAASEAITSFFGGGDSSNPLCASGSPIAKNPSYYNGRVFVDSAGSCIMTGATMKLLVPFSTTQYGPFPLQFDDSGTRLRTGTLGPTVVPAGSCRLVQITNPNGLVSTTPSFCR